MEPEAFEATFLPDYGRVYQLIHRMLGERQATLELTQETYLRAFQQRTSFRGQASPRSWLCGIALRLSLDWLRRRKRWWQRLPRLWQQSQCASFEAQVTLQEAGRALALHLPERERSVLVLRAVAQLSYEEIATLLSIPPNQVGMVLQRARTKALKYAGKMGLNRDLLT